MKELFEAWVLNQFGKDKSILFEFDSDGYKYEAINAMWIGFNAHAELTSKPTEK